jgi:hypothetical protein
MLKKILISLFVLTLVGAGIGYKMYNKPHTNVSTARSDFNTSADDILQAFKDNETEAGARYNTKIVAVSGKISSIKTDSSQVTIQLETSDPLSNVICNLDPAIHLGAHQYKDGESIAIKGICSGYLTDVILDRCVVVK